MIVILDSGILSLLVSPLPHNISKEEDHEIYQCTEWCYYLLSKGVFVVSSDICDYEIRRKLLHIKSDSVETLDRFRTIIDFLPVTSKVINKSAHLWAEVRAENKLNIYDRNIDVDIIISAQWKLLSEDYPGQAVFIATKNVKDFKFVAKEQATNWANIKV